MVLVEVYIRFSLVFGTMEVKGELWSKDDGSYWWFM